MKALEWKQLWNGWSGLCGLIATPVAFPLVVFLRFMDQKRYMPLKEYIELTIKTIKTGEMK